MKHAHSYVKDNVAGTTFFRWKLRVSVSAFIFPLAVSQGTRRRWTFRQALSKCNLSQCHLGSMDP